MKVHATTDPAAKLDLFRHYAGHLLKAGWDAITAATESRNMVELDEQYQADVKAAVQAAELSDAIRKVIAGMFAQKWPSGEINTEVLSLSWAADERQTAPDVFEPTGQTNCSIIVAAEYSPANHVDAMTTAITESVAVEFGDVVFADHCPYSSETNAITFPIYRLMGVK